MSALSSYPSVFAIGHSAIKDIFQGPVIVQEKIDGSQFSFGIVDGELMCRSKGKQLILDAPEKMFTRAVETVRGLEPLLMPGWMYRGEYLEKPKHNALSYSRIPAKHIILYDVETGPQTFLRYDDVWDEAERLGLEYVPTFFEGEITKFEVFQQLLERDSVLGGCSVEGVVVKNYNVFTMEKKVAMGKYVSEAFKEKNQSEWRKSNPTQKDMVAIMTAEYTTEARWRKAIQHLRESGQLEGSPRDIGLPMREVPADILKEDEAAIKEALFKHFWPQIQRGVTRGLPEFYKNELAKSAFE